jgi:tetratricopeptide (TPR) repeat protein
MFHRYIPVLFLLACDAAGQPVEDVREALEAEPAIPRGRFSFEDAREALEAACGSPVSTTHEAICWNDRGLWHQLQGQYTEAEAMYARAVSSFEKSPAINQRLLATTLHNLGATYRELRRLEEAKQVLTRSLALRQREYGEDHPLTASARGQLGTVHLAAGELADAELLLQAAVSTHERLLPPTHPDRVSSVHNLAQFRIAQNKYKAAVKLLQDLIAPWGSTAEPPSLVHAAPYQTLATLYRQMGEYARARPLLRKAQRLYEDSFGPDDLTSVLVRVEFGLLSAAEGNNHRAKTQLREARAGLIKILGVDHPQVASAENNLAVVCLQLGHLDDAALLLEQAIRTLRRQDDAPERELGRYLANMAEVRRRQGKLRVRTDLTW